MLNIKSQYPKNQKMTLNEDGQILVTTHPVLVVVGETDRVQERRRCETWIIPCERMCNAGLRETSPPFLNYVVVQLHSRQVMKKIFDCQRYSVFPIPVGNTAWQKFVFIEAPACRQVCSLAYFGRIPTACDRYYVEEK